MPHAAAAAERLGASKNFFIFCLTIT